MVNGTIPQENVQIAECMYLNSISSQFHELVRRLCDKCQSAGGICLIKDLCERLDSPDG